MVHDALKFAFRVPMYRRRFAGSGSTGRSHPPSRMRAHLLLLLLAASNALALSPVPSDVDAQRAHAEGSCGSLGPGSGLSGNKGWIVSMVPGRHEFRMKGGGSVLVTVEKKSVVDFDAGRPYYVVIEGAPRGAVLEWKIPGSDWGPVSKYFLYPLQR